VTLIGLEAKPLVDFLIQLRDVISHFEKPPLYQGSKERIPEEVIPLM
jgi:hypothetical protein